MSARVQWTLQANYSGGSHPPVVSVNGSCGSDPLILDVQPEQVITLDASATYDPDANLTTANFNGTEVARNALQFAWFQYLDPTSPQNAVSAFVPALNFTSVGEETASNVTEALLKQWDI